jgi:hypothetical protein
MELIGLAATGDLHIYLAKMAFEREGLPKALKVLQEQTSCPGRESRVKY